MEILNTCVACIARWTPSGIQYLGSAFLVSKSGILATANHVLGGNQDNLVAVISSNDHLSDYQTESPSSINLCSLKLLESDPLTDIATLQMLDQTIDFIHFNLGSTDDTKVGEPVFSLGYPHTDSGRCILTYDTFTIGAKLLLKSSGIEHKHLVINSFSRPGQSGSLIFCPRLEKVVGIIVGAYVAASNISARIAGINPASLNQTTYAISAEYIMDML